MSSVLSERDRAIGAYCATGGAPSRTAPERTNTRTSDTCLTSVDVKSFRKTLVAALLGVSLATVPPALGVDVVANDGTDTFEISGAVLLDGTFPEAREAAGCTNCHWRIIHTCASGPLEDRRNCVGVPCATAEAIAEVWRADSATLPPPGDPLWMYRGLACLPDDPVALTAVASSVRDLAIRAVPPLRPATQPSGTTLTGLATIFRSNQPAELVLPPAVVGGVTVQIHSQPTWTWDFGHGAPLVTSDPGGAWPRGHIRHTYPKRGIFRVRVSCTWHATYEARGIPDLPVDGVITQSMWLDLRVREARRFLFQTQGA